MSFARLRSLLRGRAPSHDDVVEELRFHLELLEGEEISRGHDAATAKAMAEKRFGNMDVIAKDCSKAWRGERGRRLALLGVPVLALVVVALFGGAAMLAEASDPWSRIAPYSGIRWAHDEPEVLHDGTWYRLIAIEGRSTKDIREASKTHFGEMWLKRFEEDIPEVLETMGIAITDRVDLTLLDLETGVTTVFEDVAQDASKRRELMLPILAQRSEAFQARIGQADPWSRVAPYEGIRWVDDRPQVLHAGRWWGLAAIARNSSAAIEKAARETYGAQWRKRFEEDIADVLAVMGTPVADHVELTLLDLDSGELLTFEVTQDRQKRTRLMAGRID